MNTPLRPAHTPHGRSDAWARPVDDQPVYPFPFIPVQQNAPPAGLEGPLGPYEGPYAVKNRRLSPALLLTVGGFTLLLLVVVVLVVPLAASHAARPALAAPGPQAGQTATEAVYGWYASGGNQYIDALDTDFQNAAAAGAGRDLRGLSAACASLQTNVAAAQAYAPIPDAEANAHFAAALAQHARSAADCLAGISGRDPDRLGQAVSEMRAGTLELSATLRRLQTVTGG